MYYVTWWQADPFIYLRLFTRMPMEMPREIATNPFGIGTGTPEPHENTIGVETIPSSQDAPEPAPRWNVKQTQRVMGATAYGWLTLATAGACAVALAGGAWLGGMGGPSARALAALGALGLATIVGYFGYKIWSASKMMFEPNQLRTGMGLVNLTCAFVGIALAGRVRGITKFAGVMVVLAAVGTAVGIWLWTQSGALDMQFAAWPKLAAAFGIHAAWGVVLLLSANRIRT
jgi:hypothetical protein